MNDLIDWKKIKADYDKGLTDQELADKHSVTKSNVRVHRNRQKWGKANKKAKRHSDKVVTENSSVTDESVTNSVTVTEQKRNSSKRNKLNDDQMQYCIYRSKGYRKSEAYRMVYDPHFGQSISTISSHATRLEKRADVLAEIGRLRKNRQKHFKWTKDDFVEQLTDVLFKSKMDIELFGVKKGNTDSFYNAVDRLVNLLGLNESLVLKQELDRAKLKQLSGSDNQQMSQLSLLLDQLKSDTEDNSNEQKDKEEKS